MDTPIDARKLAPTTDNRWSAHFRATLAFGVPLIGAQLALGINTTDVMIVGRLGAENLAAMVLAGQFPVHDRRLRLFDRRHSDGGAGLWPW